MKSFLIVGGIVVVLISLIPLKRTIQEYNVQKNGQLVSVLLIKIPHALGTKVPHFVHFVYENKRYSEREEMILPGNRNDGDTIQLKHSEGTDIFLSPNKNIVREFISLGIICLVGIGFMIYGYLRK